MSRNEVLALLREHKPVLAERFGVTDLALFGSTVRNEAGPDSDIDILVSLRGRRGWKSEYSDVLRYLEDLFENRVDLVLEADLREELRPYIEADAVYA
ncbi:MAG: nucleotidyltransferase family protein [Gemmatimonadetes bacterium]|nr:nucleotidyltransferase family protein [Dehalococcoidia bacterium]MYA11032.1 nucleotidyltransferase family protein [Gemmatimonadota bacterium]MYD29573.1 nucleotidyltransferase family protein [Dehalococcoidia bacterium]MYE60850.1 nucleotidyltransferase family protein [Candidatus Dadabacteria bacterium]MYJ68909.1 nucleotidyltransferase family protein [Gemmatimonadota bacterium]